MDKTLQENVKLGLRVSQKMIADTEARLEEAIMRENWSRAADLNSYISGMRQIVVVFEQAIGRTNGEESEE